MSKGSAAFILFILLGAACPAAEAGKQVAYYFTGLDGTLLAKTDASGNVIATSDYHPFGMRALGVPAAGPGFAGHLVDDDSGLVYMQQRYYDPVVGRFLSVDPLRPSDQRPERFMRYGYANENPYRFVDPDGRGTFAIGGTGSVAALVGVTGTRQLTISMSGWNISTFNIGYYTSAGGTASSAVGPSAALVFSYTNANSAEEMADTGGLVSAGAAVNFAGVAVGYERSLCDRCNHINSVTIGGKIPQLPFEVHTSATESMGSTIFGASSAVHPTVTVGDIKPPVQTSPSPPPPPPHEELIQ